MTFRRIGLATAMAAITILPACSMWHSMTDRMTGRSSDTTTASRSGAMGQAGTTGTTSGSGTAYGTSSYGGSPTPGSATTGASGPGSGPAGSSSMGSSSMGSSSMGSSSMGERGMGSDRTPGMAMGTRRVPMGATTATIPNFGSYNECRAWLANQGAMMNRGPTVNGEVTIVDRDPCDAFRARRGS